MLGRFLRGLVRLLRRPGRLDEVGVWEGIGKGRKGRLDEME